MEPEIWGASLDPSHYPDLQGFPVSPPGPRPPLPPVAWLVSGGRKPDRRGLPAIGLAPHCPLGCPHHSREDGPLAGPQGADTASSRPL